MTNLTGTIFAFASPLLIAVPVWAQSNDAERYIVKYSANNKSVVEAEIARVNGEIKLSLEKHRFFSVEMLPDDMERLSTVDEIEFIEIDAKNFPFAEITEYGIPMIKSNLVLEAPMTDRKVCIIDSGFDRGHEDLQDVRITGDDGIPVMVGGQQLVIGGVPQFTNETGDWWKDELGHGTFMGGIIAALGGNNTGYVSANPGNRLNLHIVKVFISPNGFGTQPFWVYTSDSVAALDQCLDAGSHIVNMSYGRGTYSLAENQAMIAAANSGVLLIAASGNSGGIAPKYPATLDAVMGVSNVNNLGYPAENSQYHLSNEISAPGGRIFAAGTTLPPLPPLPPLPSLGTPIGELHSTYPSYGPNYSPPLNNISNAYSTGSGSSMSAAYVSGVAAKLWGHFPSCTGHQIRQALLYTADDKGSSGRDRYYGYGIVDAAAAHTELTMATTLGLGCNVPAPPQFMTNGGTQPGLSGSQGTQLSYALNVGGSAVGSGAVSNSSFKSNSGPAVAPFNGSAKLSKSGKLAKAQKGSKGLKDLSFALSSGAGDADLYVRFGARPTTDLYDCRSHRAGNEESCEFKKPQEGKYFVMVHGASAFSGVSLTGAYTDKNIPPNQSPAASFVANCVDLDCTFDADASSDSDGTLTSYNWNFGDGNTGTGIAPSHSYAAIGTYKATLIVTDDDGAVGNETQALELASINMGVRIHPIDGENSAIIYWSGATTPKVDIYVDGKFSGRTENDGHLIRKAPKKPGTHSFQICNKKSTVLCSDVKTVTY